MLQCLATHSLELKYLHSTRWLCEDKAVNWAQRMIWKIAVPHYVDGSHTLNMKGQRQC